MIFDLATFHTAQPNVSSKERWNTIQGYHSAKIAGVGGTPTGGIMTDGMLQKLASAGRLTASKRRVLGMPAEDGGEWPERNGRGQLRGTAEVDGSAQN